MVSKMREKYKEGKLQRRRGNYFFKELVPKWRKTKEVKMDLHTMRWLVPAVICVA